MFNILTLNKIAAVGTSRLGDNYAYGDDVQNPDAVLVRSAAMHDMQFEDNLLAIARAGAGTNNIPKDVCSEKGIVVFNTPGANANAVKELVIAGLLLSSRRVMEGAEWISWYKGNVRNFSFYKIYTGRGTYKRCERKSMGMAKKLSVDIADLLLNERVTITLDDEHTNDYVHKIFITPD